MKRPSVSMTGPERRRRLLLSALAAVAWIAVAPGRAGAEPFAYVTNAFSPGVSVIDTATDSVAAMVPLPPDRAPIAVAITPDLKRVYVTALDALSTCGTGSVFVIDTATNSLGSNPIAVPCEPTGIAIGPDGSRAYVASRFADSLSVVDTASNTVSGIIALPRGSFPRALAVTPDGRLVYVTEETTGTVLVIDTKTNAPVGAPIRVGSSPQGIAVAPNGKQVYVANNGAPGSSISVIETGSNTITATIGVPDYPTAVAFTPDGKFAYISCAGGATVIDTRLQTVVAGPIPAGGFPGAVAIDSDGRRAYVTNEGSGSVTVIDTASGTVSATIDGMNSPRGVAVAPIPSGVAFTAFEVPGAIVDSYFAPGINDEGVVVGIFSRPDGTSAGFIRSPDGHVRTPVVDPNDHLGSTVLHSINDDEVMVGFYNSDAATSHGFYLIDGRFKTWDLPGAVSTALRAINNRGDLTGSLFVSGSPDEPGTGFIMSRKGALITFTAPDPTLTGLVPEAINDRRAVVGYYTTTTSSGRGFLRGSDGRFSDIVFPGSTRTRAFGINDCGVVVGFYRAIDGSHHGFFGRSGQLHTLDVPGAGDTSARGINNSGRVVGEYSDPVSGPQMFVSSALPGAGCD
jgi:YVTN family beta-propeller protein